MPRRLTSDPAIKMSFLAMEATEAKRSSLPDERGTQTGLFIPEQSGSERLIAALVFVVSFAYLCLFRRYTTLEPDEGIILQGAQRILQGQVLYVDFFSFLTPGSYYMSALLFKVFGNSFAVARTTLAVLGGTFSVITYLLARRTASRTSALFVAGLVTLTTLPYRFLMLHNWDSTLWACLGVYCAVRLLESSHWAWAFALGSFLSFTFLFEQSKGAGLGIGLAAGFGAINLFQGHSHSLHRASIIALLFGIMWPAIGTALYFTAQHALPTMLADWLWPLHNYSLANRVPYGHQNWSDADRHMLFGTGSLGMRIIKAVMVSPSLLIPVLPLIAAMMLVYWILRMRAAKGRESKHEHYLLTTAILCGLLLSIVIARADIIHFMYLQPLFGLVLAWFVDGKDIPGRIFKRLHPLLNAYIALAFLAFGLALLMRSVNAPSQFTTRRGVIATPAKDTVVPYLEAHANAGDYLLVYPYLPLYNYLTDTRSPTRYDYFQPGMHTRKQSQEMLSELKAKAVKLVLFESSFAEKIPNAWPHTPLSAVVNDPVADYIMKEYRPCAVLRSPQQWRFLFMVRKDLGCP